MDFGQFKVTATRLGQNARALLVQLRGVGSEGDDDGAEPYDDSEVRQPLGLFARPVLTPTLQAFAVRLGHQIKTLFLTDKGQAPFTDVDEGETRTYGVANPAARVRHRADGTTNVESDTAHGKDVVLNGGTSVVAAVGDSVLCGVLSGAAAGGIVQFTFQPYGADGLPSGGPIGPTPTITIGGVILLGPTRHVKA